MNNETLTTDLLTDKLLECEDIDQFIAQHKKNFDAMSFSHFLYMLSVNKGLKISEVLKNAQLTESYGYQLFNGNRLPSRDKVLQLIFGLSLDIESANKLLKIAGKSELYVRDKRDAIIMFALNKGWCLIDTEGLLLERNLEGII